jgi:tungstate transport system permease protein
MDIIWEGLSKAFWLIVHRDPDVIEIVLLTLRVSGTAVLISMVLGVPAGTSLAVSRFPGRGILVSLVNAGMSIPPVVVGLIVMVLLWRTGPLGPLGIIFTPWAMISAQVLITFPIVTGITMAAISQVDPRLRQQLLGIGASRVQLVWVLLQEARMTMLTAVMAGFGRAISEVGAVMMVGGNIKGQTRVLTTATVLESGKGEFGTAIALGLILLVMAYLVTSALTVLQQRGRLP